jgi:hypothetical protein
MVQMDDIIGTPLDPCVCVELKDRCAHVRRIVGHLPGLVDHFATMKGVAAADKVDAWFDTFVSSGKLVWQKDAPRVDPCDVWCPARETLRRGKGDCMDFSIIVLSAFLDAGDNNTARIFMGCARNAGRACVGHAWVEGRDSKGLFLFESTYVTGPRVTRGARPAYYVPSTSYDGKSKACVPA